MSSIEEKHKFRTRTLYVHIFINSLDELLVEHISASLKTPSQRQEFKIDRMLFKIDQLLESLILHRLKYSDRSVDWELEFASYVLRILIILRDIDHWHGLS